MNLPTTMLAAFQGWLRAARLLPAVTMLLTALALGARGDATIGTNAWLARQHVSYEAQMLAFAASGVALLLWRPRRAFRWQDAVIYALLTAPLLAFVIAAFYYTVIVAANFVPTAAVLFAALYAALALNYWLALTFGVWMEEHRLRSDA